MPGPLAEIDRLIRGDVARQKDLAEGRVVLDLNRIIRTGVLLALVYGLFMGLYAILRPQNASLTAALATAVKVPFVFLLTFVVTFPSLYVFSTLAGSRCSFLESVKLLSTAIAIDLAVLASLGPILGFFTLSTDSYPFMVLLNVLFFGIAGAISIGGLSRSIRTLIEAKQPSLEEEEDETDPEPERAGQEAVAKVSSALRPTTQEPPRPDPLGRVFPFWVVVYAIVGAQMGWILRPFVGTPDLAFTWFRPIEDNVLIGIGRALVGLFG